MLADVVLLTGSPGTGKSTTARSLAGAMDKAVHLHTDDFWHVIVSGRIEPYLPESDAQNQTVMRAVQRLAWTYAAGGYTTVVDGIVGPWMLHHFGPDGTGDGPVPRLHYVVLRPSREVALRRAQARTAPDALLDEGPVTQLWDQLADLGPLEDHALDTTDHTPDQTLVAVRRAVDSGAYLLD